jgi:Fe-S-cluster containining protein
MKLDVIPPTPADEKVWYQQGLRFTCTTCGNCCTGGPGFVWLTEDEIARLADHLQLTVAETTERYCRRLNDKFSLKEARSTSGTYDCIFLKEVKPPRTSRRGEAIVQAKRVCGVYEARPLQCRTWPFWPENLDSKSAWEVETRKCPGMNTGRHYTRTQIEAVRDSADWPEDGPTS